MTEDRLENARKYLEMIGEPPSRKRPIGWRGAALGKELLRLQYSYIFGRSGTLANNRREATRIDLYQRIGRLYGSQDKLVLNNYKRIADELPIVRNAFFSFEASFRDAYNLLNFRIAKYFLEGASLSSSSENEYKAAEKCWDECQLLKMPPILFWGDMWNCFRKLLALNRTTALISLVFLGKEDTIAFPEKEVLVYAPIYDRIRNLYDKIPPFFHGLRFPSLEELKPLKDNEPLVIAQFREILDNIHRRPIDIDAISAADLLAKDKESVYNSSRYYSYEKK